MRSPSARATPSPSTQLDRGVFRRARLVQAFGDTGVRTLLERGELRRLRHGWYADATAHPKVVRAVTLGGQLTCLSALDLHGAWVPDRALHVAVRRQRGSTGLDPVLHPLHALRWTSAVAPVDEALAQAIRHHDPETVLMVCESAAQRGLIGTAEVERLLGTAQQWKQPMLSRFNPLAESGSETRIRLFLTGECVPVRIQVWLTPRIRVDHLVGESWVIEADGAEHHGSPEAFARDRARDLTLARMGYRVTRLSYQQIFHTWEDTKSVLAGILRTRQHRRPPKPVDMVGELPQFPATRPW